MHSKYERGWHSPFFMPLANIFIFPFHCIASQTRIPMAPITTPMTMVRPTTTAGREAAPTPLLLAPPPRSKSEHRNSFCRLLSKSNHAYRHFDMQFDTPSHSHSFRVGYA